MRAKRIAEWLQLQTSDAGPANEAPSQELGPSVRQRIREQLEARGVSPELSESLAAQLEERAAGLGRERLEALLEGAALACGACGDSDEGLDRSASELREIERMMGAFAGELSKLDETLEVLAAYVRRMRSGMADRQERVLH